MSSWVGLKVGDSKAHVTVTWLGKHEKSSEFLEELNKDLATLKQSCATIILKFGEWTIFGKSKEIDQGRGLMVRKCEVVDEKQAQLLNEFHKKWYHHEDGEAEERKSRQSLHVSVGKMTKQEIDELDVVECDTLFLK